MNRYAWVFMVSVVAGGILGYARESRAFWARQEASYCRAMDPRNNTFAYGCNYTATAVTLECPVKDTGINPKSSITTMSVFVSSNTTSASYAARCVNFWSAPGTACGGGDFKSGVGMKTLNPPSMSQWTAADFGFIDVTLAGENASGAATCVKGYLTQG